MLRQYLLRRARLFMASHPPDFEVKNANGVYLQRWHLLPKGKLPSLYLHRFLADDEDRALHDHPYASASYILDGGYFEHLPDGSAPERRPGDLVFRRATAAHRVRLRREGMNDRPVSAVSLFFTGQRVREWGFHCPKGWVLWKDFVDDDDRGMTGKGCGD